MPFEHQTTLMGFRFHDVWDNLLETIIERGSPCNPRKKPTRELLNTTLYVHSARYNVLVNASRNPNYRSMVAEWLWIQFGFHDVRSIAQYIKKYEEFSDDGHTLTGAYGPRVVDHIGRIIQQLEDDPDTRQAVLPIWKQGQEIPSKDVPCTISLQFLIREDILHTVVNMRSSDAWLGLPYDFFVFSQLANCIAAAIGTLVGSLAMHLGSSHLYEENLEMARLAVSSCKSSTLASPLFPNHPDYILMDAFRDSKSIFEPEQFNNKLWYDYYRVLREPLRSKSLEILRRMEVTTYGSR